jgi:hypothetical protein
MEGVLERWQGRGCFDDMCRLNHVKVREADPEQQRESYSSRHASVPWACDKLQELVKLLLLAAMGSGHPCFCDD